MAYLECNGLKRYYSGKFTLDLSFEMEQGELLCIIGPSGSGKTSLLSLLSGVDSPDGGRILLNGCDITDLPIQKRRIGMVFQDFSLFPSMNVAQNIQYGMKDLSKEDRQRRTAELLDLVGLSGFENRSVNNLSGGEAQRIALARAIAAQPQILLLDEPLSALDAPLRKRLRTVIRQIHDATGITTIYVTHDRDEAFAIADRVMIMNGGGVEAIGSPKEIYSNPPNLFSARFSGEGSCIPMSLLTGDSYEKTVFIRPEDIKINDNGSDNDCIILKGASVVSVEYSIPDYFVRLSYKGTEICCYSSSRPDKDEVDLALRLDKATVLE